MHVTVANNGPALIKLVDVFLERTFISVCVAKVAMILLDIVDINFGPSKILQTHAQRIENVRNKISMKKVRDLCGHHRRDLLDRCLIVAVTFGHDIRHANHQIDDVTGNSWLTMILSSLLSKFNWSRANDLPCSVMKSGHTIVFDPPVQIFVEKCLIVYFWKLVIAAVDVPQRYD